MERSTDNAVKLDHLRHQRNMALDNLADSEAHIAICHTTLNQQIQQIAEQQKRLVELDQQVADQQTIIDEQENTILALREEVARLGSESPRHSQAA